MQQMTPVILGLCITTGCAPLPAQGRPVDIGGYYLPDVVKTTQPMHPSATFNAIIDAL